MQVTKLHFPLMIPLGDITKLKGRSSLATDLVCGGTPCQNFSLAAPHRIGLAGERSSLFWELIRLVKEIREDEKRIGKPNLLIRPRYVCWENVPGAFSANHGEDFRIILEEFCKLADDTILIPQPPKGKWLSAGTIMGDTFSLAWRVFDAQYWSETPQRRKRIYLILDLAGQSAGKILFEQESLFRHTGPGKAEREGTSGSALSGAFDSSGAYGTAGILQYGTGRSSIPLCADTEWKSYCISGNIIGRKVKNGGNGLGVQPDISYTLTASDRPAVYFCQTCGHAGSNRGAVTQNPIRYLTPLEHERLQGFPSGWTAVPNASDAKRYKALGNSIAIPCADYVLRGIAYFLRKE